jgi:hypothetical protein
MCHAAAMQVQEHIAMHGIVRVRRVRKVLGLFELEVSWDSQQQQQWQWRCWGRQQQRQWWQRQEREDVTSVQTSWFSAAAWSRQPASHLHYRTALC